MVLTTAVTTRQFAAAVLIASLAVLGSAMMSQYWGGLVPCELCLLQRWPWRVAIVIAAGCWIAGNRAPLPPVALALALVYLVSAGLAFYHVGVEQHWFAGPTACTSTVGGTATNIDDLKRQLMAAPVVLCDRVQWSLFGVSMAGWNFVVSLGMAACCAATAAWLGPRRAPA